MPVPSVTWGERGFIAPPAPAVLEGIQGDINAAFGRNLNYQLTTPQGQLATSEAATVVDVNSLFVYYTNQVDPAYATGRMQDAIARIYFLQRRPAEPTVLQVECAGAMGVVIPEGASIIDGEGNIYLAIEDAVIPSSGLVTVGFAARTPGPLPVPDNVSIYQTIPQWDSVTVLSGAVGQNTESRAQFEERRRESVAKNSVGSLNSVLGVVLAVDGVLDAYVTENDESVPDVKGGVTLAPNSLYVAVVGGTNEDVARAIWTKKMPGCGYNGNTEVIVEDTNAGYSPPLPSYTIKFQRPSSLQTIFAVTLTNNTLVPADAIQQVRDAIVAAFTGADGGTRQRIGATIYASRYITPLVLLGQWCQVQSLLVGSANTPAAKFSAAIAGDVMSVSSVQSGTLAPGQTVIGTGITVNTTILSQSSGIPGSVGEYIVSRAQTVAPTDQLSAVAAYSSQPVRIDQAPELDEENIAVVFV